MNTWLGSDETRYAFERSVNSWGRLSQILLAAVAVVVLAPAAAATLTPWLILAVQGALAVPIAVAILRSPRPSRLTALLSDGGFVLDVAVFSYVLIITGGGQSPLVLFIAIFLIRASIQAYSLPLYAGGGLAMALGFSVLIGVRPNSDGGFGLVGGVGEAFTAFQIFAAYAIGFYPLQRSQSLVRANQSLDEQERLGRTLAADLDLGRVLRTLLTTANQRLGCDRSLILLRDERDRVSVAATEGLPDSVRQAVAVWAASDPSLPDPVRGTVRFDDLAATDWYFRIDPTGPNRTALLTPIALDDGPSGVLVVTRRAGQPFTDAESQRLEALVHSATSPLRNALAYQRSAQLTAMDDLTGLLNSRRLRGDLDASVASALADSAALSFIMLDLDHFKEYNDTYGHPAGDEVLRTVGGVLRGLCTDTADRPYRYGGEEFSLLLAATDDAAGGLRARAVRRAVNAALADGHTRDGRALTVSVGVATLPGDASDARSLVRAADGALYRAKALGRNRVEEAGTIPDLAAIDAIETL